MKSSEEHLRLVFDAAVDGIVELDLDDVVVRTNEAFCQMVHLDRGTVEGQRWQALAASLDGADARFAELPSAGQAQLERSDGTPLYLESRVSEIPTDPPRRLVLIRDVTPGKAADQTIRSLLKFLQEKDEDRTSLLRRTNSAIESERNRIARDLHDGPVQGVSAASLSLEAALQHGVSIEEVRRAQTILAADFAYDNETNAALTGTMGEFETLYGAGLRISELAKEMARLGAVTAIVEHMDEGPGTAGPNVMRHVEQTVLVTARTGLEHADQLQVAGMVDDYVFGHAIRAAEHHGEKAEGRLDYFTAQFATGEYPHLQAIYGEDPRGASQRLMDQVPEEQRFETGLACMLDGIEVWIERRRR